MGLKVLALPLLVLGVLSILSISGLTVADTSKTPYANLGAAGAGDAYGYFDSTGVQIAYANQTWVSGVEQGAILLDDLGKNWWYYNSSGAFPLTVNLGASVLGNFNFGVGGFTVFGVLIVVVGIAVLASFNILSSGISDVGVSAIVKGTFFSFIFVMLAVNGGSLLNGIPVVGGLAFLSLSVLYVVGVVDMFGHPSGA